jgi:tetratricopeptide (TPR) repeat protein
VPGRSRCDPLAVTGAQDAQRALELADEALMRGDFDGCIAHLSAAVRASTVAGEPRSAAMSCVRLGDVLANAMGNLTAGRAWFARARRLVDDLPPCVEQGWVAVAAMGCDVDDPDELLAAAEIALDRARRFGDVDLETKAMADAGLAHVRAGRVAQGMTMLDEAMALACGPADDRDTVAKSVCSFFTACYHAADYERTDSWSGLLRQRGLISLEPVGPVFLSSHCDSVRATLLVELGRWAEAEALLQKAKADFESVMGVPAWHPVIALADLRIRQGRLTDAEALLLGRDQAVEALVPAVRLHLARGAHGLACSAARRGLRVIGDDRLRGVELLALLVDAELGRGDVDAAVAAGRGLEARASGLDVPAVQARAAIGRARALVASGRGIEAVALLEATLDAVGPRQLPWLRAALHVELARCREQTGDRSGAAVDAKAALATLAGLDVVLPPADAALLERLAGVLAAPAATLTRAGKGWTAAHGGTSIRLTDTKGLRYLAELVARPGSEQHVLDLVDRIEGVGIDAPDLRALGDAGEVLDARARAVYRHRIEELRAEADEALAAGMLETAEARQAELDELVRELARAFGLGGRDRRAASAAERARLNVTRAVRAAVSRIAEALPEAGGTLDRGIRTGIYCAYEPGDGDARWIVQS